ncbi:hypothetical protein UG55_11187 [Frankia sp. EI5c]|nr:hypothetical protein UG55_11187 [Frankia sp. EI5c]
MKRSRGSRSVKCYLGNMDDHPEVSGSTDDGRGIDPGVAGRNPRSVGRLPEASSIKFAPANVLLAACHPDSVRLWDLAEPTAARLVGTIPGIKDADAVSFPGNGTKLSVVFRAVHRRVGQLWNIADPTSPRPVDEPQRCDETPYVTPPGAVGEYAWHGGHAWNLGVPSPLGLKRTFSYQRRASAEAAEVSTVLVAVTGTTVELWDITNPAEPSQVGWLGDHYSDYHSEIDGVSLSPDSRILAVGRYEEEMPARYDPSVHLWDVSEPAAARPLAVLPGAEFPLMFSPDSAMLAATSRFGVQVWDLTDPQSPRRHGAVCDIARDAEMDFSADGVILAAVGRRSGVPVTLWKVR